MRLRFLLCSASLVLAFGAACSDDGDGDGGDDESGTAESGTAESEDDAEGADADADQGDGDGDQGDGDGDQSDQGDGDGDTECVVGSEGCPCTPGGGCDPGLMCEGGVCVPADPDTGDGDGDTGDGDGDGDTTGDGDGDTTGDGDGDTTGDGDGDGDPDPYQACPGGDDSECAPGEVCVTGDSQGVAWSLCTIACQDQQTCDVDDQDGCADLPGDGEFMGWCSPVINCSFGNPCPQGMQCLSGFQNNPAVCIWPN